MGTHIQFRLAWLKPGASLNKAFKSEAAKRLFDDYLARISPFSPVKADGIRFDSDIKVARRKIWICDRGAGAKTYSSETLADSFKHVIESGAKELYIIIGGPDGFNDQEIEQVKPDMRWSFGPMTLPHELAALVAAEQIYRAFTILKRLPYHLEH